MGLAPPNPHRRAASSSPTCFPSGARMWRPSGWAFLATKPVDPPTLGPLRLHHLQPIPTAHPDLRLTQFAHADHATRMALRHFASRGGADVVAEAERGELPADGQAVADLPDAALVADDQLQQMRAVCVNDRWSRKRRYGWGGRSADADFAQLAGMAMCDAFGHPDPQPALLHVLLGGFEYEDQRPLRG